MPPFTNELFALSEVEGAKAGGWRVQAGFENVSIL